MKPQKPFHRFLIGAAAALLVVVIGFSWINALIPTWGSTPEEAARALPGDEMVTNPDLIWNHAVTIQAPAEAVYPWLAQIGDSRAAFYSITFIENTFCATSGECRYTNANQVRPEWQTPEKDRQGIIMDYMVIHDYQPGQWVMATATGSEHSERLDRSCGRRTFLYFTSLEASSSAWYARTTITGR